MKNRTNFFLLSIFICIFFFSCKNDNSTTNDSKKSIPSFSVVAIDGESVNKKSFKGKVTVLIFFTTWCENCLSMMPYVEKNIWQKFKYNTKFTMITIGRGHSVEELKQFSAKNKFSFPIAEDPQKKIYSKFANKYVPRIYIIDKNGYFIYEKIGFGGEQNIKEIVEKIKNSL